MYIKKLYDIMEIKKLCDVMLANDFSNKDITNLRKSKELGFPLESGQELADEIYAKIDEILRHGVNSGFNKSMENAISTLVSIIVQIITASSPTRINNLRGEYESAINPQNLKTAKLPEYKNGSPFEILEEVVEVATGLCEVMSDKENTKLNKELFKSSLEILEKMRTMLPELWDVTSYNAATIIAKICNKCVEWLTPVGHGAIGRSDVAKLESALKEMENLQKMLKHGPVAKDGVLARYDLDMYKNMNRKKEFEERLKNLKDIIKRYEKNVEELQNEYLVRTSRQEIEKLQLQAEAIVVKMDNGEIEVEDAEFQLEMLDEEIESKREMLADDEEIKKDVLRTSRNRQRIINEVKKLISQIDMNVRLNENPAVLASFMIEIDEGPICAVLNGTLNDEDNDQMQEAIRKTIELAERLKKRYDETLERAKVTREKAKQETSQKYPQKEQKRQTTDLASKYRKKSPLDTKNKEQKKDPVVIDPFDDSNL